MFKKLIMIIALFVLVGCESSDYEELTHNYIHNFYTLENYEMPTCDLEVPSCQALFGPTIDLQSQLEGLPVITLDSELNRFLVNSILLDEAFVVSEEFYSHSKGVEDVDQVEYHIVLESLEKTIELKGLVIYNSDEEIRKHKLTSYVEYYNS